MICFLDIDEVLVDFVGPALQLHGYDVEAVKQEWPSDVWSVQQVLGISNTKFWKPINEAGSEFWENLPEKPWIDEMLCLVSMKFSQSYLVSSPSLCPSSYTGKANWIHKRFGKSFDKFLLTPHKELLAGPGRVLIDDNPYNVKRFVECGGHGIHFPMWGNYRRRYLADPVRRVRLDLEHLISVEC